MHGVLKQDLVDGADSNLNLLGEILSQKLALGMGTLHCIHIRMDTTVLADENTGQGPKLTFVLDIQNGFFALYFTTAFVISNLTFLKKTNNISERINDLNGSRTFHLEGKINCMIAVTSKSGTSSPFFLMYLFYFHSKQLNLSGP